MSLAGEISALIDRRAIHNFETGIVGGVVIVVLLGIINLYGAATFSRQADSLLFFNRQIVWFLVSLVFLVLVLCINYHTLIYYAFSLHLFSLFLLCLVIFVGKISSGAQRWLEFGPLSFQPSEFTKITLLLALSKAMSKSLGGQESRPPLVKPLLVFAPTIALVLIQPDLGTSVVLLLLFSSVLFFANIPLRRLLLLPVFLILFSPVLWVELKDYQKDRVLAFVNPNQNPLSAGYHINQSKIAIGSGGLWGRGFGGGTQGRLRFLPEQHTDFAFSSWSEQFGFVGATLLVAIYFFIISRCLRVAYRAKDGGGFCLAMGISALIFWQAVINVGMALGLLPVVGITLPFFSYGGSSLLTCAIAVGLVCNISLKRFL